MKWAVLAGNIFRVRHDLMGGVLYDTELEALRQLQMDQRERIILLQQAECDTARAIAELTNDA